MIRDAAFHLAAERHLLAECAASGQMSSYQVRQHQIAGGLPAPLPPQDAHSMAMQIADDASRVCIECRARSVATNYPHPVYDISGHEPDGITDPDLVAADMESIGQAVKYLDLRQILVRPIPGKPHYVSFGRV